MEANSHAATELLNALREAPLTVHVEIATSAGKRIVRALQALGIGVCQQEHPSVVSERDSHTFRVNLAEQSETGERLMRIMQQAGDLYFMRDVDPNQS